jgi:hypothetical protein
MYFSAALPWCFSHVAFCLQSAYPLLFRPASHTTIMTNLLAFDWADALHDQWPWQHPARSICTHETATLLCLPTTIFWE